MRRRADPRPRPATTLSVNRPQRRGGAGKDGGTGAATTLTFPLTALIHPSARKMNSQKFVKKFKKYCI